MSKLIITRGLPGAGKSTWAVEQVKRGGGNVKRVNRDGLRDLMDGGAWSKPREQTIIHLEQVLARTCLANALSVIVDDTNLPEKTVEAWRQIARDYRVDFEIKDFTDVPLEVCIERNTKRSPNVPEKVIRRMWRDHLMPKPAPPEHVPGAPSAIIVDMDGTLAKMNGRSPYDWKACINDLVHEPIADIVRAYVHHAAPKVIIVSGRMDVCREETITWLGEHAIPFDYLYMRKTDDNRPDDEVKRELYEQHIKGRFNVKFVLDDRSSVIRLWRALGLTALQVADGDF